MTPCQECQEKVKFSVAEEADALWDMCKSSIDFLSLLFDALIRKCFKTEFILTMQAFFHYFLACVVSFFHALFRC